MQNIDELIQRAEDELKDVFFRFERIEQQNQLRVLEAFWAEGVAARHFSPTTGYGYDDGGRDTLDRLFARVFFAEDALVRPHFASGTHTLVTAITGLLLPKDVMLCVTGVPYDTLQEALGIRGNAYGSIKQFGIGYEQVELLPGGKLDHASIRKKALELKPAMVYLQRSRGYNFREAVSLEDMKVLFDFIKENLPGTVIMVDNCYGEFCDVIEPTAIGADVIAGSLIKNPGGGLAPTGGYIAGTRECIEKIANRLTAPGIGREVGSYAASYQPFYQGLFLAPHVTCQSLKSAALFARAFELLGMTSLPKSDGYRSDIIQSVKFSSAAALIAFCKAIQSAAPVDSFASPEPWDMPGYAHQVIMAAGSFVQGASIELSADAPIVEPYVAYVQGALTYAHGKIALKKAISTLSATGEITL